MAIVRKRRNPKTGKWEDEEISKKELKKTIMQANGWNEEQYRKQYDIFKNKLRFYEELQKARGIKYEVQSPQELLYKIARAKQIYGDEYEPSQEVKEIQSVTAHSISKGRKIAQNTQSISFKRAVQKLVNGRFGGFIAHYDRAKQIINGIPLEESKAGEAEIQEVAALHGLTVEQVVRRDGFFFDPNTGEQLYALLNGKEAKPITDPLKQEKALKELAKYLHERNPRAGKDKGAPKKGEGGIAEGETFGSGEADSGDSFDYSEWL